MEIPLRWTPDFLVTVLLLIVACPAQAGQDSGLGATPSRDRSFYLGRQVMHPESLSGIWETSDGHGGAVGIHLIFATSLPPSALSWTPQSWEMLQLGVFQRKGAEIQPGEEGGFSDSPRGGGVTFDGGRLQLHFASHTDDVQSVDVELVQASNDCWSGRFHRGTYDSPVTLCRPAIGPSGKVNLLVGTWLESTGMAPSCVHIAQQATAQFTGWSDAIQLPGKVQFPRTLPGPHLLFQTFGELMKVHVDDGGVVSLELRAYSSVCCSYTYVGRLSEDGALIHGSWRTGQHHVPGNVYWKRIPGPSCVTKDSAH